MIIHASYPQDGNQNRGFKVADHGYGYMVLLMIEFYSIFKTIASVSVFYKHRADVNTKDDGSELHILSYFEYFPTIELL